MSDLLGRREFLSRAWKVGFALIAAAGAWTTWDLLKVDKPAGFGGTVRTLPEADVPSDSAVAVRAARAWLTKQDDQVVALSQICPHLGCRVSWCESSGEFECPCHGSVFNRVGQHRSGPTPRGMDRHPVEIVDGVVVVDTDTLEEGDPLGTDESINEPTRGPSCAEESHA